MKIYTRRGDGGETGFFGGGRIPKDDPRVEAYGSVDELSTSIGLARLHVSDTATREQLGALQADLFAIGAHLATPPGASRETPAGAAGTAGDADRGARVVDRRRDRGLRSAAEVRSARWERRCLSPSCGARGLPPGGAAGRRAGGPVACGGRDHLVPQPPLRLSLRGRAARKPPRRTGRCRVARRRMTGRTGVRGKVPGNAGKSCMRGSRPPPRTATSFARMCGARHGACPVRR